VIEEGVTRFLEVSSKVHITGSDKIGSYLLHCAALAVAVAYNGGILGITQTDLDQFSDFVSDLFDSQSQFSSSHACLSSLWLLVDLIDPNA
jgi:hypothetical protein